MIRDVLDESKPTSAHRMPVSGLSVWGAIKINNVGQRTNIASSGISIEVVASHLGVPCKIPCGWTWSYDDNCNCEEAWTGVLPAAVTTSYTANALNQTSAIALSANPANPVNPTYDNIGNCQQRLSNLELRRPKPPSLLRRRHQPPLSLRRLELRSGIYTGSAVHPGGFDYTGADCCGWMKEAGFRKTRWSISSDRTRWWWASSDARAYRGITDLIRRFRRLTQN